LQQTVKMQQGRPRRGKGILLTQGDTKMLGNERCVEISYDVNLDRFYIKNPTPDEETRLIYQGWNSCYSTGCLNPVTEYITKIKAFNKQVEPRKRQEWCVNLSLTQHFVETVEFRRGQHVALQRAYNSCFTDRTTPLNRRVLKDYKPFEKEGMANSGMVTVDVGHDFVYGSTQVYICFNEEDPAQLSPEQDPEISIFIRLTHFLPVAVEKAQLIKLFNHFSSICKQGDGHLLHYQRVEILALRVLKFLKSTDALRDSIIAEKYMGLPCAFDAAVLFLRCYCQLQPSYRALFLKPDIFRFIVGSIQTDVSIGISDLLVGIFEANDEAIEGVTPQFVRLMMSVLRENLTTRPMTSLDSLRVLIAMVTVDQDSISARDNGNIILLMFLKDNSELQLESPFVALSYAAFESAKLNLKDNLNSIKSYLEELEQERAKRSKMLKRGTTQVRARAPTSGMDAAPEEAAEDGEAEEGDAGDEEGAEGDVAEEPEEEEPQDEEDPETVGGHEMLILDTSKMFFTSFTLRSIELFSSVRPSESTEQSSATSQRLSLRRARRLWRKKRLTMKRKTTEKLKMRKQVKRPSCLLGKGTSGMSFGGLRLT